MKSYAPIELTGRTESIMTITMKFEDRGKSRRAKAAWKPSLRERLEDRSLLSVALVDLGAGAPSALVSGPKVGLNGTVSAFEGQIGGQTEIFVRNSVSGQTSLVSVAADGITPANAPAQRPIVSPDGRYVAFESAATNLSAVPPSTGGMHLYVRDLSAGKTIAIDQTADGASSNGFSTGSYVFSPVGDRLAFSDTSSNLTAPLSAAQIKSGSENLYLHDFGSGATSFVATLSTDSVASRNSATSPASLAFSPDGTRLAYTAWTVLPKDPANAASGNSYQELYVHDFSKGNDSLISAARSQNPSAGNVSDPVFSPDGRSIAYVSTATDLAANPASGLIGANAYLTNLQTHETALLSPNASGLLSDGNVSDLTFRGDGQAIAFTSTATDLLSSTSPATVSTTPHIYVRDLLGNAVMQVDIAAQGGLTDGGSSRPVWSPDGKSIAFVSAANNLTAETPDQAAASPPGQTTNPGPSTNVFVRNLFTQETFLVSSTADGHLAAGQVLGTPVYAADGQSLTFADSASDLAANAPSGGLFTAAIPSGPSTSIHFASALYEARESDRGVLITVTRDGSAAGPSIVRYSTTDGTAKAGSDYAASAGLLNFAPGQRTAVFGIPLNPYDPFPGSKTVGLSLSDAVGGTITGPSATLSLTAGSAVAPPNPIANPSPTPLPISSPRPTAPSLPAPTYSLPIPIPQPAGTAVPTQIPPVSSSATAPIGAAISPSSATIAQPTPIASIPAATINPSAATAPAILPGPRAIDVVEGTWRHRVTSLTVQFNQPLNPLTAENVANYRLNFPDRLFHRRFRPIIRRPGPPIGIESALYNPLTNSTTLTLSKRSFLRVARQFKIWINGSPGGIVNLQGTPLNANAPGQAGSDTAAQLG